MSFFNSYQRLTNTVMKFVKKFLHNDTLKVALAIV